MALKRRIKKLNSSQVNKVTGRKILICKECNYENVEVSADIVNVTCAYCVQKMLAPPPSIKNVEKSDKVRGWHFKIFYEHNDVIYSKGKIITDPTKIEELRHQSTTPSVKKTVVTKTKKRGKKRVSSTK